MSAETLQKIRTNQIQRHFQRKKNILELSRVYFRSSLIWIFTYNMLHQTFQKKNVNKPFDHITTFKKKKTLGKPERQGNFHSIMKNN